MGEPIGDEFIPGMICVGCWGIGQTFGDVPTPLYVRITFTGLTGGCAAANRTFIATQSGVNPCLWEFDAIDFGGSWTLDAFDSSLNLFEKPSMLSCFFSVAAICSISFTDGPATGIVS